MRSKLINFFLNLKEMVALQIHAKMEEFVQHRVRTAME
jgi:hypothetical protein